MEGTNFINNFISRLEVEPNRYSSLMIALSDARKITGRDVNNGEYKFNILGSNDIFLIPHSFIGIINYLLILDMIGEIFKLPTFLSKSNNIYNSLKQFSCLEDRDIDVVIALRNSLAHNYGLINIPYDKKEYRTKLHKFTLDNQQTSPLIEYPNSEKRWSGNFNDKSENSSTIIGYIKLCDLVETVYYNVKENALKGLLILALKQDIIELKSRFTIRN